MKSTGISLRSGLFSAKMMASQWKRINPIGVQDVAVWIDSFCLFLLLFDF